MTPTLVLLLFVLPAIAGSLIGRPKGYPVWGGFAGLMLSWIGVLAVALWKPDRDVLVRRERARLDAEEQARRERG